MSQKVKVHIDYIQKSVQANDINYPEKTYATITDGNENIAESLVARGLTLVIRYRNEEDFRASNYGALLDAEEKAKHSKNALHGPRDKGVVRIVELSNDLAKAKQFFPFLNKKAGASSRIDAVVEYVFSASRIKIYIPKQNCACNLILAGVNTPRSNAEYGPESTAFVKSAILQRTVSVTIDAMDKVGNFIGNLYFENGKSLAVELLTRGFASIRDDRGAELKAAEDTAKAARLNIWKDWKEEEAEGNGDVDDEKENEDEAGENGDGKDVEKKDNRKAILITQVADDLSHFYAQFYDDGPALDSLMTEMREELESNPPLPGAYAAKKGDIVAAKFSLDGQWYRAKVEKVDGKKVDLLYIDYGNRETLPAVECVPLPSSKYHPATVKEAIHKFALAFVTLPDDKEVIDEARSVFESKIAYKILLLRREYKDSSSGLEHVTVADKDSKQDIVLKMVEDGFFVVKKERRRERNVFKTLAEYRSAEESAKKNRVSVLVSFFLHFPSNPAYFFPPPLLLFQLQLNLWRYGDFTEDDAREFGYNPSA